jgi:hypothetical protein
VVVIIDAATTDIVSLHQDYFLTTLKTIIQESYNCSVGLNLVLADTNCSEAFFTKGKWAFNLEPGIIIKDPIERKSRHFFLVSRQQHSEN